jgi:hypothetical protein
MQRSVSLFFLGMAIASTLFSQGLTSVSGATKDPSGAVIPGAKVELFNPDTGARRTDTSGPQGRYSFSQVLPGNWRLTAQAPGFSDVTRTVELLVNTPATVDLIFEKIGAVQTAVSVSAESTQVNTDDATLGNAVAGPVINQLPFEARNVVGLLAIQPGVSYLGEPSPGLLNDPRSGSVDGGKSDQANVSLDGVDVNDQQNRAAFKSVLRVTLDSVQEFRTTTTNAGAEFGHSSGAQVTMVTKGGGNTLHGSAYEYLRNTDTSANSFFNNSAGVARQKLNRNVYGASVGGPIRKNRMFYFLNYEGRKDASDASGLRTVPNDTFRQGIFTYTRTAGGVATLTPDQIRPLDPGGIGVDPAVLQTLQAYPHPNDKTVGDGLNTAGFRFNASAPLRWNTYIAKLDYRFNDRNQIFFRGNLQNDHETTASGIPQFPGEAPTSLYLENSKGYAAGWTSIVSPSFVSTFRYGYTRQGVENTGSLSAAYAYLNSITPLYATSTGLAQIIPVHDFHEDLVWTKGKHTLSFGAEIMLVDNQRASNSTSFSTAFDNALWLQDDGNFLIVPGATKSNNYLRQMSNLIGYLPQLTLKVNYDLQGSTLPQGATVHRKFAERHYDFYVQDSWKVMAGLTVSAGLRVGLAPAIYEANGYNVSPAQPLANYLYQRGALGDSGQSQALAGPISYLLASTTGRGLYPYQKNFGPRVSIAYSPQSTSGLTRFLVGGPNQTSIRAGWGMYYDAFGQGLETRFSNSVGFSTSAVSPPSQDPLTIPRYTGFYNVPPLSAFPPAPPGGFPQSPPAGAELQGTAIDDQLKAPYTMNANVSIGRQFKGGFFVELSFVDRQSRRSLIGEDIAMPTNLRDPVSGQTYFQAADQLGSLVLAGTPVQNVPKVPFWENLWPGAATSTLTATQSVYNVFKTASGDWTTALYNLDINCAPACSKLGKNALFNSQYVDLFGYRSVGKGSYNGLHWTVRKAFRQGYQFDFNYAWSKCEDFGSSPESSGANSDSIINAWNPGLMKGVCDYDTTHQFSSLAVAQLPLGKGKKFLGNANKFVDNIVGGWQISSVFRNTSGFPVSVNNGVGFPTNWCCYGYGTQTGPVPQGGATKNAPSAIAGQSGGPNIFSDPGAALAGYSPTLAGGVGSRNAIRGNGVFNIDLGLSKRFHLFNLHDQPHSLQVRAEAFNFTNSVRFDPANANLNYSNQSKFGQYTQVLGTPRVFQFSARYEF